MVALGPLEKLVFTSIALCFDPEVTMRSTIFSVCVSLLTAIFLAACASDLKQKNSDLDANGESRRAIALFDLRTQQKLPWPNVIAQTSIDAKGNTIVGPLRLPNPTNDVLIAQVNQLPGFTLLPVITVDFSRPISIATVLPGKNLVIVGVDPLGKRAVDNMSDAVEIKFDAETQKLRIYPLLP